jgi:tetratricopeptide (TPR) repeat protein
MTYVAVLTSFILSSTSQAQDVITLAPRTDHPGRITLTGKVLDYTGALLTYENTLGAKQSVPGKQVLEIRSTWSAEQEAGNEAWRRRDYEAAAKKFQAAYTAETRRWVRRMIVARLIAAEREQNRWEAAAEQFLVLLREDPATPYFAAAPLAWTSIDVTPTLQTKGQRWLDDRTSAAAALLGASYLLSTPARADAVRRLRELTLDGDPRIALSAEAQLWRADAVTADASKIAGWERTIEKIPEPLRAGPYLTVGRTWSLRKEPERAALALLRVPILYGDAEPRLAAEALWTAGQALERLTQPEQAARLYRELLRDFPQAVVAGPAQERLKELAAQTKP